MQQFRDILVGSWVLLLGNLNVPVSPGSVLQAVKSWGYHSIGRWHSLSGHHGEDKKQEAMKAGGNIDNLRMFGVKDAQDKPLSFYDVALLSLPTDALLSPFLFAARRCQSLSTGAEELEPLKIVFEGLQTQAEEIGDCSFHVWHHLDLFRIALCAAIFPKHRQTSGSVGDLVSEACACLPYFGEWISLEHKETQLIEARGRVEDHLYWEWPSESAYDSVFMRPLLHLATNIPFLQLALAPGEKDAGYATLDAMRQLYCLDVQRNRRAQVLD